MKKTRILALALTLVLALGAMVGCSGAKSAAVEKSYWKIDSFIDSTWGVEMNVIESYTLNLSGDTYQLTRAQQTTQDVWIDITYYGSLFGTFTVTEEGDELVYKLSAPTRAIYANGQIEAVTSQIDPIMYDSDDQATWPETLDGENATTKEAIIANAFTTALALGDNVTSITVRVAKAGGMITSVVAD